MLMHKHSIYWYLQLFGWLTYVLLAGILNKVTGKELTPELITTLLLVFTIGIASSHLYRSTIQRLGWAKLGLIKLIPRVLFGSAAFSVLFEVMYFILTGLFVEGGINELKPVELFTEWLNWSILYLIWSLIYFAFHFFERYKDEEIKNLRWEASKNEIELNKLKSQLNPHFIFNSMNIIRALVDEDPVKAKKSITQLSNILRKTLQMGKHKTVSFEDEMKVVMDYLELEKARFEERLVCESDIAPGSEKFQVPVLMIQTLVENGIKHGISQLPNGGKLILSTEIHEDCLHIRITNSGKLKSLKSKDSGFGLVNTKQRLQLLYGSNASLKIEDLNNGTVATDLVIPKNLIL